MDTYDHDEACRWMERAADYVLPTDASGDDALALAEAFAAYHECGEWLALLDHPIYEDARQVAAAARRQRREDALCGLTDEEPRE